MNLDKIVSSLASSGVLGGLAGGAVSGALMGNKQARKAAGTLLKVGGVAALGTLAWKAYQSYQQGTSSRPGAAYPGGDPVWQGISQQRFEISTGDVPRDAAPLLLVEAMIAAACADGHMDVAERKRILMRVDDMGLAGEEKALVFDALQEPPSLSAICERVDSPELAAEVYLSSLLAVDSQNSEARLYLDALAFRLGIPDTLVASLQQQVAAAPEQVVA